ncbi:phage head-tail joining protein [Rhizorhabdus histidinilytica]|uniref:phage head-tail joining protein n=1 Tax=Rhizorhabdus histidinilytica TaxID=439228 RepID=UPI0032204723
MDENDIAALKKAMVGGVLKVRFADGREVTYRSLAEMREIIRMAQSDSGVSTPRTSVAGF